MSKKSDSVDVERALKYKFPPVPLQYTERDTMLYALGVGAAAHGPKKDEKEHRYVYENNSQFAALPSMGVIFPFAIMTKVMEVDGLTFNPMMLLHGEQDLTIHSPIAPSGSVVSTGRIRHLWDKGKGAVVVLETETKDATTNKLVCVNVISLFIRGIGGFGGDRGPAGDDYSPPADRTNKPDHVHEDTTTENQALLYRLGSGDMNPLHADPAMAAMGGFDTPILHGLCTFGHAARAILLKYADGEPARARRIACRFSRHVFPGETIVTEMWKVSPTRIVFRCKVKERPDAYALSNGCFDLNPAANL